MKSYNSREYISKKIQEFEPLMAFKEGEDFKLWQEKSREKLVELLGLPLKKCEDCFRIISKSMCKDYEQIDFEFQSEEGYYVSCSLLMPIGTKKH